MKHLKQVAMHLVQFWRGRPLVCMLILLGLAVSSFCLNVYYARGMDDVEQLRSGYQKDRELVFVFPQSVSSREAFAKLQGGMADDFYQISLYDGNGYYLSSDSLDKSGGTGKAQGYGVVGVKMDNYHNLMLSGRDLQDGDEGTNNAVADRGVELPEGENPELLVGGETYAIVGVAVSGVSPHCLMIDYRRMVEQDTPLYAAKFVFPAVPTQQQLEQVKQALVPLDPQTKVIPPDPPAKYTMDFLKRMAFPLVLSAFALVSIAALIGFSFHINRRKYNIYKLCGATKGALCMLCVTDIFVFTVLGYLLGSGASVAFMAASDWASYELSAANYALLYLLVLALTLLFAALPIQRVTRHFERIEI